MANKLIFFAAKMWAAFAKATHFCSKNNNVFENMFIATTVKEFVINQLVKLTMLWTTGLWMSSATILLGFLRVKENV